MKNNNVNTWKISNNLWSCLISKGKESGKILEEKRKKIKEEKERIKLQEEIRRKR